MATNKCVAFALLLAVSALAGYTVELAHGAAPAKDPASTAKKAFGFDALPGKHGPTYSTKGLDFAALLEERCLRVRAAYETFYLGRGLILDYRIEPEPSAIDAPAGAGKGDKITQCHVYIGASPLDAQEMLFAHELGDSVRNISPDLYMEGLERSDVVGDFCIASKVTDVRPQILFVRGNVAFTLSAWVKPETLLGLAKALDAAVQKQPVMTSKELAALATPAASAKNPGPVVANTAFDISVALNPPLAEGQSVVVTCEMGPRCTYDPAAQTAVCTFTLPGTWRAGIAVYDKASRLSRWTVLTFDVKPAAPPK
jgi:hypothetical protein